MMKFTATVTIEVPDTPHFDEHVYRRVMRDTLRDAVEDNHRGVVPVGGISIRQDRDDAPADLFVAMAETAIDHDVAELAEIIEKVDGVLDTGLTWKLKGLRARMKAAAEQNPRIGFTK